MSRRDPREVGAVREWMKHPEDEWCNGEHCAACNVDEPVGGEPYYLICGECYHPFRTKRDMRREVRRCAREMLVYSWWQRVRLAVELTFRVDDVEVCPMCAHDL